MGRRLFPFASVVLVLFIVENAMGGAIPDGAGGAVPGGADDAGPGVVTYGVIPTDTDCTYIYYNQRMSWNRANNYCQGQGMELAAPKSFSQQSQLTRQFTYRETYWIGIHDKDHEGLWYPTDHYAGPARFFNWQYGQPDGGYRQNCVQVVNYYQDGKWDDAQCYLRKNFVCQRCTQPWGRK